MRFVSHSLGELTIQGYTHGPNKIQSAADSTVVLAQSKSLLSNAVVKLNQAWSPPGCSH